MTGMANLAKIAELAMMADCFSVNNNLYINMAVEVWKLRLPYLFPIFKEKNP